LPLVEKAVNEYYFEFAEQEGATILVSAFVTPSKPTASSEPMANEQERIQALQNMFQKLSGIPDYVVYFGNPEGMRAQGTAVLVSGIRGAISRKSRARITIEEVEDLIGKNLVPSSKKLKPGHDVRKEHV
jgi:hypothetical protein